MSTESKRKAPRLEVVSPELVLVSPDLAAITWRRENLRAREALAERLAERPAARDVDARLHHPPPARRPGIRRGATAALALAAAGAILFGIAALHRPEHQPVPRTQVLAAVRHVRRQVATPQASPVAHKAVPARSPRVAVPRHSVKRPAAAPVHRVVAASTGHPVARPLHSARPTAPKPSPTPTGGVSGGAVYPLPGVLGVSVSSSAKGIVLHWTPDPRAPTVALVRHPGLHGAASALLYRGNRRSFLDATTHPGGSYRYELFSVRPGLPHSTGIRTYVRR